MPPTVRELVVYTPAKDFELSKRFYKAVGFTLTEGFGDTMDCRLGGAVFRLQDDYVKDWAENFMMKFDVDDVDAWHAHARKVIDEGSFGDARYDTPELVGGDAKVFNVWDPSGVLLIFVQS